MRIDSIALPTQKKSPRESRHLDSLALTQVLLSMSERITSKKVENTTLKLLCEKG